MGGFTGFPTQLKVGVLRAGLKASWASAEDVDLTDLCYDLSHYAEQMLFENIGALDECFC